jgi:hypothetical protein
MCLIQLTELTFSRSFKEEVPAHIWTLFELFAVEIPTAVLKECKITHQNQLKKPSLSQKQTDLLYRYGLCLDQVFAKTSCSEKLIEQMLLQPLQSP